VHKSPVASGVFAFIGLLPTFATSTKSGHRPPPRLNYATNDAQTQVMVGGAVTRSTATTEPPRDGFPITGLLVTRASVTGTPLWTITPPRSLAHAQSELDFRPVFSTQMLRRLPKTQTHPVPVPSRAPALRQHILTITVRH
jgi:hypothetical protein